MPGRWGFEFTGRNRAAKSESAFSLFSGSRVAVSVPHTAGLTAECGEDEDVF